MKPKLFDILERWRHTLGYGVHSPLAYHIIKECVHPDQKYAYYADSVIRSLSENADMYRQMRLIIRLVNVLALKSLWIPKCPKTVRKIIAAAYPNIKLSVGKEMPEDYDFVVIFDSLSKEASAKFNSENGEFTILSLHSQDCFKTLVEKSTLILDSQTFTLFIRRNCMQPVAYTIL